MDWLFKSGKLSTQWHVFTDGAIRPERGTSGLAAIVRDEQGNIIYWWQRKAGRLTCNEAECAAVLMALEALRSLRRDEVEMYSDSRLLVDLAQGRASAHTPGLRKAQYELHERLLGFRHIGFHHIPRELNRLADALANEAVEGWGGRFG